MEEVKVSIFKRVFDSIEKRLVKLAVLQKDIDLIESQYDKSILSFFRFLKDHVNDSIVDSLLYAGFITEYIYHQHKEGNL